MRRIAVTVALAAILTSPVRAQSSWQEYSYPDQQFAVSFPGEPTVTTLSLRSPEGTALPETLYSLRQETGIFQVAVIDYSSYGIDERTVIDQAVAGLRERGEVKLDIEARVQRNFGRYLNIAGNDGSHTIAAVFFGNNRLYEIEGTVPASSPDALSGEMIRFQQSLRFMGDAAGRRFRGG